MMDPETDKIARAICQETCAFAGEPACWTVIGDEWPNPHCNQPGCVALAMAAKAATPNAWKPMDTCPNDGRWFLAIMDDSSVPSVIRPIGPRREAFEGFHAELSGTPMYWADYPAKRAAAA